MLTSAASLFAASPSIPILARRPGFCVVAKPAGLVVHRNDWSRKGDVALLQLLRDQLGTQVNPVHRLDAGTSGCLVFAEDSETTAALQRAFASGRVRKTYIAVARGNAMPTLGEGLVVERPVRDDKGVLRAARTELMCLGGCDGEEVAGEGEAVTGRLNLGASLVVAEPTTGRFHQIRKHLGGLSHPILGDAKHGDSRVNRWWREERGLRSLALHCASLEIELEEGGEVLQVRCPVREDIADLCGRMPWADAARAALPGLLDAPDPWAADDLAALERMKREAEERAAGERASFARVLGGRARRAAWGGKSIKTAPGTVLFVEAEALLARIGGAAGGEDASLREHAGDVPCQVVSREVRPAPRGESGKYVTLQPLHAALEHRTLGFVHSTDLLPMHARFGDAWQRHGEGGGCAFRAALLAAVRAQRDGVASHLEPADLFRHFAPPDAPVPAELRGRTS